MKALLLALGLVTFSLSGAFASQQQWRFKVFLDEQAIGYHNFRLSKLDDVTHITVDARFDVQFLFFNAYSYLHQNYEVWHNNCLQTINSQTNDNGDSLYVQGQRQDKMFVINTAEGKTTHAGCLKTFAYWDASFLNSPQLLNAQTGEVLPVQVKTLDIETVDVCGTVVKARRYRLVTDEFSIDLWYSLQQQEWLALQSTTKDGTTLRYQRIKELQS